MGKIVNIQPVVNPAHVQCRAYGHGVWERYEPERKIRFLHGIEIDRRCSNCGTTKHIVLDLENRVQTVRYDNYPEGYELLEGMKPFDAKVWLNIYEMNEIAKQKRQSRAQSKIAQYQV